VNKCAVVQHILKAYSKEPKREQGTFFAPSNIALCKYWGKRDTELNLPHTSSLSISLGNLGAKTTIALEQALKDRISINGKEVDEDSIFSKNLSHFLDLFRPLNSVFFRVATEVNIPIGAGLASSACGFAAVVGALDQLYGWELPLSLLSILGRLGSGSASRSFWHGFVEWQAGHDADGMDSAGACLESVWPALRIGVLIVDSEQKKLSSRIAMQNTVLTSPFYKIWPEKQARDLKDLKKAIEKQDFMALGETTESNALAMHALMLTTSPPILYSQASTLEAIDKIWHYRQLGLPLYFTQDAGPNLKLLFLEKDEEAIIKIFPKLIVVSPFNIGAFQC